MEIRAKVAPVPGKPFRQIIIEQPKGYEVLNYAENQYSAAGQIADIKDLGFCGVQMAAHYGSLYLDEDEFRPYFKFLNGLGVPVVVHHTPLPVDYGSIVDLVTAAEFVDPYDSHRCPPGDGGCHVQPLQHASPENN